MSSPGIEKQMPALPSNARLLAGLRSALNGMAQAGVSEDIAKLLGTADTVLNELLLRRDIGFYVNIYGQIWDVAQSALPLLRQQGDEEAHTAVKLIDALPEALAETSCFEDASRQIEAGMQALEKSVHALRLLKTDAARALTNQAIAVEMTLSMRSHAKAPGTERQQSVKPVSFTREKVQAYLEQRFPGQGLKITTFRRLVGGYQKTTILFDTEDKDGNQASLVLRGEKDDKFLQFDCSSVKQEFDVVLMAYNSGIPVPEPLFVERDDSVLGNPFMVTRRAPGESLGSAVAQKAMSGAVIKSFLTVMAQIHAVPLDERMRKTALGHWLEMPDLETNTRFVVESWHRQPWLGKACASPALTRLYDWLLENVPEEDAKPCFIHIDYGPHNVLVENERVTAVLDWESARIGDPAEDITYFMQSVGGKIDRQTALDYYYQAGGAPISEYRMRYFEVFNTIKILTASLSSAAIFEYEPDASLAWCDMGLLYRGIDMGIEAKIKAAESVKPA